ncbi:FkbM family methyltransferase [Haloferula rosea]|uniref:FkbM family methyltransferase n=1 Tax=Haloferula rosea TaxID=490093 RepID=A0A934RGB3_9BACT|nr:FkbM family methyltransferase [Haloferula rosea]MBK1827820.1 FkbM family methyltransferase [Haloferula rosea]
MSAVSRIKLAVKHLLGRDLYLRPSIKVPLTYHGSRYEGWAVPATWVTAESVVYSFGIGENASWDLELIAESGCRVHGFDPTPKSLAWAEQNVREPRFVLHPYGLADEDGDIELWLPSNPDFVSASCRPSDTTSGECIMAPVRCLGSIMDDLGHDRVDVLKMDIEGAEYPVIEDLCRDPDRLSRVHVLLIEFHHWMSSFDLDDTRNAIKALEARGFSIAWTSERGHEVLFVRSDSHS